MRLILDSNIIFSALIRNGISQEIILNKNFDFFAPAFTLSEIDKYASEICKKSKMNENQLQILLNKLFCYITIINPAVYAKFFNEASILIMDKKDIPFLACALALNCPIWSEDKEFKKQQKVKIYTTRELLDLLKR